MKNFLPVLLLVFAAGALSPVSAVAAPASVTSLDKVALENKINSDAKVLAVYRAGLSDVMAFIGKRDDLFPPTPPKARRLLTVAQKNDIRATWQRISEYYLALDSLGAFYGDFHKLKDNARAESLGMSYAILVSQYSHALKLIPAFETDGEVVKVLNETMPELGLPKNSYAQFKFLYLNVKIATQFAALSAAFNAGGKAPAGLAAAVSADSNTVWQAARGRGPVMTAQNGLNVLKAGGNSVWFPVQAGVSEWMGDAKVLRQERSLISPQQIKFMMPLMQPGDIILERREWYLSNIGLPGFWPHGALYIGTPEERRAYFTDDETREWVKQQGQSDGDFDALLKKQYAKAYDESVAALPSHGGGHVVPRVIEAVSEGVVFSAFEHTADADAFAVLRPRLPKWEKASAIFRSFKYSGRPYDFDFDFQTDAALVCTELVYKSYEPQAPVRGVKFPLVEVLGRLAMPANLIAKQFDEEFGKPGQQTDLVTFFDGRERKGVAVEGTLDDFRKSWQRPKWHIFVQEKK